MRCHLVRDWLDRLERNAIAGDVSLYTFLLRQCTVEKALAEGKRVHAQILASRIGKEPFLSNLLIQMYANCSSLEDACAVFNAIRNPNFFSWNILLSAYTQNCHLHLALKTFYEMPERTAVSWTNMLTALAQSSLMDEAKLYFERIPQRDIVCWNAVIAAYAQNGQLQQAKLMFDKAQGGNIITWTTIVSAYVQNQGNLDDILHMVNRVPMWNSIIWNMVVNAYTQHCQLEAARSIFDRLPEKNIGLWNILTQGYAKIGQLEEAVCMFQDSPQRDVISWGTMISAHAQNGELDSARALFQMMSEHNVVCFNAMITAEAQVGRLSAAHATFDCMPQRDMISWNAMITAYGQNEKPEVAWNIFRKMPMHGIDAWNTMILAFGQNGELEETNSFFQVMPARNVISWANYLAIHGDCLAVFERMPEHNLVSIHSRLACAADARTGHLVECCTIFDKMMAREVVTWNILIRVYVEHGYLAKAAYTFDSMPEHNVVSYNSMLQGYVRNNYPDKAAAVFTRMPQKDIFSWTALVSAFAHAGHAELASAIFQKMPQRDSISWNGLLTGLLRTVSLEEAELVVDKLQQVSFVPGHAMILLYARKGVQAAKIMFESMVYRDSVSWVYWVHVQIQFGTLEDAKSVYDRSPQRNQPMWNSLIHVYCRAGHLQKAKDIFEQIPEEDRVSCTMMIIAFAQCGNIQESKEVFDIMRVRDTACWNAMMTAYIQTGHSLEALKLFKVLDLEGINPNVASFVSVLNACASSGSLADGRLIHAEVENSSLILDATVGTSLINLYGKCGNIDEARRIFNAMPHQDVMSWTTMTAAYAQNGYPEVARSCFNCMPERDPVSWNAILSVYANSSRSEQALDLLKESPEEEELVSMRGGNLGAVLVNMYGKCGELQRARKSFEDIIEPDIFSWTAMVTAYAHNGYGKEALELFQVMTLEGIMPDTIAFTSILSACNHSGLLDYGCQCFTILFSDYGLKPTYEHYLSMIDLHGRAGRTNEAEEVILSMPYEPDSKGRQLSRSMMNMDTEEAVNTFSSITGANEAVAQRVLQANGGDLNAAINAYFNEGDSALPQLQRDDAERADFMEEDEPVPETTRGLGLPAWGIPGHAPILRSIFGGRTPISDIGGRGPTVSHPRDVRDVPVDWGEDLPSSRAAPIAVEDVTENAAAIPHGYPSQGIVSMEDDEPTFSRPQQHGSGIPIPIRRVDSNTFAPQISEIPTAATNVSDADDVEEEMLRAAIEASRREAAAAGGAAIGGSGGGATGGAAPRWNEEDELARAVSLSLKTAEEEKIWRSYDDADVPLPDDRRRRGLSIAAPTANEENVLATSPSRYHTVETDEPDEQPLLRRRSNRRLISPPSQQQQQQQLPSRIHVQEDHIPSAPEANGDPFRADEWGGISSEEQNEAVMLEAALFGGLPESAVMSLPYQLQRAVNGEVEFDPTEPETAVGVAAASAPLSPSVVAQRLLREQQDDEYLASLAADREKELKAKEEAEAATKNERLRLAEEQRQSEAAAELEKILAAKAQSLPPEPSHDDENAVTLLVRLPDGSRQGRRFRKTDKLQGLFDYIDSTRAVKPGSYRLVRQYPRRTYTDEEHGASFDSLGLTSKQEALFLECI